MEEEAGVLELAQRQHAELEGVAVAAGDFPPSVVAEVRIVSPHGVQGLERVVGEPEVVEVLFHELTDAGHVGVVHLLVEHRTAVAGVAARAAAPRGREEELCAAPLGGRQRAVVAGQEPVPGRVPRDRRAQEGRRRPQDGDVVDQQVQVARRVGLGGLLGKRVPEELLIGRELLQFGGLDIPASGARRAAAAPRFPALETRTG